MSGAARDGRARSRELPRFPARFLALVPLVAAFVPTPSPGLVTHGPAGGRMVALTFDADPLGYDPRIVQELRAARTPATVFLTGLFVRAHARLVRALAGDPLFELENHSYDHAAWERPCYGLTPVPERRKRAEVTVTAGLIARVGHSLPRYFRFPGGCQNESDVRLVRSLGEQAVQWDVISGDSYLRAPASVERQVLAGVRPGSIVVMHLNGMPRAPATAQALASLLPALRARGFHLVTLRRLLGTARPPKRR